ncbi:hypothetical protein D3C87_268560 [compost metagenome]
MKINFTFLGAYYFRYFPIFLLLLFYHNPLSAQSTRVYATAVSSENNTDLSSNAVDGNLATKAAVRASSGLALGIGAYSGYIELEYPAPLPANTTSYVKIQTDENLLPALLGGSLGNLLSNVLGAVLIGNQEFTVQAKNGNSIILQGDSQDIGEFATERLRIVTDETGAFFIAITPSQPYNRIRLRNRIGSLLGLFNTKELGIYDAFYISDADNCGYASYTSYSGEGISLDLLNLGGAGVTNPQNVLDSNPNSFSKLSLGILGVAASIEQTVYFDGLSETIDEFDIRLKVDPSLLALGVANNIQIIAYNGPAIVDSRSLNSLLNLDLLTLLQGNQIASIPFAPNAPADRITIRYSSLLNLQLTQSLDLYDIVRVPKLPTITDPFTLNAIICSGTTASLVATTAPGNEIRWYNTAQGGVALGTVASGVPFQTTQLNSDTVFYVAAAKIGCMEESRRVAVPVKVIAVPTAADINIPDTLTACQGNITLSPTTTLGGAIIRYYTDQNKTQEITTGYTGDAGVTYVKDPVTGALTISGLNATDSPYSYFISLTSGGLCENAANTLKEVTVNFSTVLSLQVQPAISGCGSVNLADAILNLSPSNTYIFFDASNTPITPEAASNITSNGTFYIQAQSANTSCSSDVLPVVVTVNPQPSLAIANTALVTQIGNTVTLNAISTGTITWYTATGTALPSNIAGPFATAGIYTFTVIAVDGTCSRSGSVTITVLDPAECPPLTERNYADSQRWNTILTGGVINAGSAADGNPQTFSTITTGIGLLGIGTTSQILEWNETIPAGTAVTLKLGSEYSGLTLVGGFSVVGTKRNGSGVPVDVGTLQPVSGSLLNLLSGQNNFEYTFVPSNNTGPQAYDGVRIEITSLVSVAQSAKVYEAYYKNPVTQVACGTGDAEDVLFGAIDLGVGAATALVGVGTPRNAIDNSETSFATMFSGAGILAAAELTAVFRTPSIVGDTLKIRISRPSTLLTLNLLAGLSIQPMLNDALSGAPIDNSSVLLNLQLLPGDQEAILTIVPQESFDRIRIRFGGVANVLDQLRIHNIERVANTKIEGADINNAIEACQGETITLEADSIACTSFIWYDARVGGNIVSTGNSFTIPDGLPAGQHVYYIQPVRFGCEFMSRGRVSVTVTETAPEDAIASVQINGGNTTSFCSTTGNVVLDAVLNTTLTITNPVFYWYSLSGTTQTLIPSETDSSLSLTGLAPGTYTYFVGISSDEYCQTALADRTQVTFTILPPSTAGDVSIDDKTVCLNSTVTLTPTSTLANPQFTYYFTNDTTQPITNGTIGGITYALGTGGTLSITGLLTAGSPFTYYVAVTSDTTCLNTAGNLQAVTVTVGNPPAPTTGDPTQNFCSTNDPTVADLQVNEPNVVFYNLPIGGVPLPTTTPLAPGIYYAAQIDGDCESDLRLAITVTIGNPPTPTTAEPIQNFCQLANPTVASIQVNEANVVFYDALVGGNQLAPTTPLTTGIYFATILDGTCESEIRLAITVTITDPGTPTTDTPTQNFCQSDNPTVADLDVNQTNVVFYSAPTGGTPLALTDALTSGTYYASLLDPTGCESVIRLEITVNITIIGIPTTNDTTQDFCLEDNPTVASIQTNETNVIFFNAPAGGSQYAPTAALTSGIYYAALTDGICQSETRLAITVTVANPATPTTKNTTQNFCLANNPTIGDLDINESNVVFYDVPTGGTPLATTAPLTAGIYYVALQVGDCESAVRLAITVTISNPATPTTNDNTQEFCRSENPTVADLQVNEPNVVFYNLPSGGTALAPTDALTNGTYYASLLDATGCESVTRLEIAVTITVVGIPTTDSTTQNFCQANNPTVGNIQVNEAGVVFYDAPTGGNLVPTITVLTSGVYYASIQNGICESEARLAITVTITNPSTPTTNNASQSFCLSDAPTVASIQVNGTSIAFYDTPTGGNLLAPTTALTNGIYYAVTVDGICQSTNRLAITVTVNNPNTPTTNDPTQEFCQADAPTVADLQVNETNVVFYNTPNGGNALASTTPLVAGIYYVALSDGTCQSATRLAITVQFLTDGLAVITGGGNEACYSEAVTYTTAAGMSDYIWDATGGTITAGGQTTDNFATVTWNSVGTGTISVTFTNTTGCSSDNFATRDITIGVCSDITISKTASNLRPSIDENIVFTITVTNSGLSHFTDLIINEPLQSGFQYISSNASFGTYSNTSGVWTIPNLGTGQTATLQITVKVLSTGNYENTVTIASSNPTDSDLSNNVARLSIEPICLVVYNEFSPNNDGDNDLFRIDCIENYPNNTLQIHNRYGVEVYKTRAYQNTWDGTANVNSPINEDKKLPTGTYYYILDLGDGTGTKSGWLYLIR